MATPAELDAACALITAGRAVAAGQAVGVSRTSLYRHLNHAAPVRATSGT